MANARRRILLVDPDVALTEKLGRRLRKAQFEVQTASDGAKALEAAVAEKPDLVVTNYHLPLFDGERLRAFLRNNPTTSQIPFIYLIDASREKDLTLASIGPDAMLIKPFRWEEISARVESALNPARGKDAVPSPLSAGVEGSLKEVSLVDLLQIFSLNRRTGVLQLTSGKEEGRVTLKEGEVVNCSLGQVGGEKALYRILRWQDGVFAYKPETSEVPRNISRSMDALLMEGMRQLDEWQSLRGALPPGKAVLKLTRTVDELPRDLRPVTQEILLLLEFYRTLEDIVEKSTHTDYDVCKTILGLIQKGILIPVTQEEPEPVAPRPLFAADHALKLNRIMKAGDGDLAGTTVGKILVFSVAPDLVRTFLAGMGEMEEFSLSRDNFSNQEILNSSFGSLGTLEIGEKLRFRLFLMPSTPEARPLWEPFSVGAVGGILLGGNGTGGQSGLDAVRSFMADRLALPHVTRDAASMGEGNGPAADTFQRLFELILEQRGEGKAVT